MKKLVFALSVIAACTGSNSGYAQQDIIKKTITLGTIKSADAYRNISRNLNYGLEKANRLLDLVSFAQQETQVTVCILTVRDLGFSKSVTYTQVCQRALQMGYQLCPAEVGPALRLQCKHQPNWVPFDIAMKPITGNDGYTYIFSVEHLDSSSDTRSDWLDCRFWDASTENSECWFPNDHVVFMCSK
jgi:hypothetical protein